MGFGYYFVNITIVTSYYLDIYRAPFSIHEKTWYRIKTVLSGGQYLAVSINDTQVFNVSLQWYYVDYPSYESITTRGSFGFGGLQDQERTIENVVASTATTQHHFLAI